MNCNLILWGLVFLFNPEVNILDVLPDFIGYLLIARAVAPLAPLSPSAEEAITQFRKLAGISVLKTVMFIPLISVASTDPAFYLLFTLVFAILSLIYAFPAFKNLFDSLNYFAGKYGMKLRFSGAVKTFLCVFITVRHLLALIPESVYLYIDGNNVYDTAVYPLAYYKTAIVFFGVLIGLIIGIIWLILTSRFFQKLKKNTPFQEALRRDIANTPFSKEKILVSGVSGTMLLVSLSAFAMIGYNIDGKPIIPLFLAPICLLAAMKQAKKTVSFSKSLTVYPILSLLFGISSYAANTLFCERYHETASVGFILVKKQFAIPVITEAITCLFLIGSLFSVYKILKEIVQEHTGNYWESSYISHNSAARKDKINQLFKLKLTTALGCILLLSGAVSYALLYVYPEYRFIHGLLSLAWAAFMTSVTSSIKLSVKEKYADAERKTRLSEM